jgi:capsular exopolysaccharide synthesis family protein
MNTQSLVNRIESQNLPQWNAGAPGYIGMESGGHGGDTPRGSLHLAMAFRRYWWIVLLIWAVIAVPLMLVIFEKVKPKYQPVGLVNVAPTQTSLVNNTDTVTPFYTEYLHTQADLMKSPIVLQRATEDPRLKNFAWFRELPDQVGYLQDHLEVSAGGYGGSQNINVSMTHEDAEAATAIVDAVIDAYFFMREDFEVKSTDKNLKILRDLQAQTKKSLDDNQLRLTHLLDDAGGAWSDEDRKVLGEVVSAAKQNIASLQAERLKLQAQLDALTAREAPKEKDFKASINTDADPQIDQWMKQVITLRMKDADLAAHNAVPTHRERVSIREQLATLEPKIEARREEIRDTAWKAQLAGFTLDRDKQIKDMNSMMTALDAQTQSLTKHVNEQEELARTLGNKSQPIGSLREQIVDEKDALKRYTDRIEELENQNRAPGRVTKIGNTVQPKSPKVDARPKFAAAANGAGLLLGLSVMLVLMKLRNRIEHPDDLPEAYQPLVVGTVSNAGASIRGLHGRMNRKILGEEMRLLHANLLPPGRSSRKIMMVTSPTPSNGKTSISSQLAVSLAKSGLDVLLIDADLRKRDLSTMYDVGFRAGLAELLQGRPPELIRPIELLPNLRLMGAGARLDRNPVELFQKREFHESLGLLQEKFDVIIVDTPPALVVADARLIARSCDEVLCVVRMQVSSPKEVNQTLDALSRITGRTPKIIINGVAHRQSYYKYKFTYASDGADDTIDAVDNTGTTPTTTIEAEVAEVAADVGVIDPNEKS